MRLSCKNKNKHWVTDSSDQVLPRDAESGPKDAVDSPPWPNISPASDTQLSTSHWRPNPSHLLELTTQEGMWRNFTRPCQISFVHHSPSDWELVETRASKNPGGLMRERALAWKTLGAGVGSARKSQQQWKLREARAVPERPRQGGSRNEVAHFVQNWSTGHLLLSRKCFYHLSTLNGLPPIHFSLPSPLQISELTNQKYYIEVWEIINSWPFA